MYIAISNLRLDGSLKSDCIGPQDRNAVLAFWPVWTSREGGAHDMTQRDGDRSRFVTLASEIVSAYVSNNHVQSADLPKLLSDIHGAIQDVHTGGAAVAAPSKATTQEIRRSVTPRLPDLVRGREALQDPAPPPHPARPDPGGLSRQVGPRCRLPDDRPELFRAALAARPLARPRPAAPDIRRAADRPARAGRAGPRTADQEAQCAPQGRRLNGPDGRACPARPATVSRACRNRLR